MCGRHNQLSLIALTVLFRQRFYIARVVQHALNKYKQVFARVCQAQYALAFANEYFNAQLFFQVFDVFGNAGLRGKQRMGPLGEVEVLARRFADDAQLLKIHAASFS